LQALVLHFIWWHSHYNNGESMSHRNKLPAKARYDESVPAGTPIEQWIWLLDEWNRPSYAFARIIVRLQNSLKELGEQRQTFAKEAIPSEETQKELIVELELIAFERGSLSFRSMEADEAAAELLDKQGEILAALGQGNPSKLERRTERIERRVNEIETQHKAFCQAVEAERAKLKALCPVFQAFHQQSRFIAMHRYGELLQAHRNGVVAELKPISQYGEFKVISVEGEL
jgi:hypothetical protein